MQILFAYIKKKAVLLQPICKNLPGRDGGIGRHEGLKILWPVMAVWVQVPLAVRKMTTRQSRHFSLCSLHT